MTKIDRFMARFPDEGITFDDVTLNTRPSTILPEEANLEKAIEEFV